MTDNVHVNAEGGFWNQGRESWGKSVSLPPPKVNFTRKMISLQLVRISRFQISFLQHAVTKGCRGELASQRFKLVSFNSDSLRWASAVPFSLRSHAVLLRHEHSRTVLKAAFSFTVPLNASGIRPRWGRIQLPPPLQSNTHGSVQPWILPVSFSAWTVAFFVWGLILINLGISWTQRERECVCVWLDLLHLLVD